jgi:hypothetical protein
VPPNTSATQTATLGGLTYVNAVFSATTAAGFRGFGAAPVAPPTQNFNNLGAFSLGTAPFTYTGNTFALRTTFTAPEGIAVTNTALFIATLTGTVTSNPSTGRVTLDFDNTPRLFTFTDANCQGTTLPGQQTTCGTGSFSFAVNDLEIDVGQLVALTGQITGAQQALSTVPEPGRGRCSARGCSRSAARPGASASAEGTGDHGGGGAPAPPLVVPACEYHARDEAERRGRRYGGVVLVV